jgi:hypothetical protein
MRAPQGSCPLARVATSSRTALHFQELRARSGNNGRCVSLRLEPSSVKLRSLTGSATLLENGGLLLWRRCVAFLLAASRRRSRSPARYVVDKSIARCAPAVGDEVASTTSGPPLVTCFPLLSLCGRHRSRSLIWPRPRQCREASAAFTTSINRMRLKGLTR